MPLMNSSTDLCAVLMALVLPACGSGAGTAERSGAAAGEDFAPLLADTVAHVIVPTYAELQNQSQQLEACAKGLRESTTDDQLAACQSAWVAARVPWEQSEAFLFGPVTDQGLDPAVDSWPVDHRQLDALLASSADLSASLPTSSFGGGMKGFHAIEYLLWGPDHRRDSSVLAAVPRELEYLVTLSESLATDTVQLHAAWSGVGTVPGYAAKFAASGAANGLYNSQLDAVHELIAGMVDICDEVAFGKIAEPHKTRDPNLIESQYSYNALLDFADNIRSVRNVYFASRDGVPALNSLSTVVAKYDSALDARVARQLTAAIAAINAIGDGGLTFRDAILDPSRDSVIDDAQDSIASLLETLNGAVLALFIR